MKKITTLLMLVVLAALSTTVTLGAIRNVPSQHSTVQAGLNAASPGDTVLVQPGTYLENITWPSVQSIKLISAGDSSNTIIDGNAMGRVLYFNGTMLDTTTVIKGFTLRNGLSSSSWYGAGIYFNNAGSPLILETAIVANKVTATRTYGAGVSISNSSPVFRDVSILRNIAASPSCSYHYGGGVYVSASASEFVNVIIADNIQETCSRTYGTGMYLTDSDVKLTNVLIANNVMKGTTFTNGAGINCNNSYAALTNVTISGNRHASGNSINGTGISISHSSGKPGTITMVNTISWNLQAGSEFQGYSGSTDSIKATYSDIRSGWTGTGNISSDPLFVSTTDFKLQNASPCIDAGTSAGAPLEDITGLMRTNIPDIGAYENIFNTGIGEKQDKTAMAVYPNPVKDQLTIILNEKDKGKLKVVTVLGQVIYSEEILPMELKQISVSFAGYPAGIYSVFFEKADHIIHKKVIKQ